MERSFGAKTEMPFRLCTGSCKTFAFVGAALVAARRATACSSAGGHKARPYAVHFPFNFDEAHD